MKFFDPNVLPIVDGIEVCCRPVQLKDDDIVKRQRPIIYREPERVRQNQRDNGQILWPRWSVSAAYSRSICYAHRLKDAIKIAKAYQTKEETQ